MQAPAPTEHAEEVAAHLGLPSPMNPVTEKSKPEASPRGVSFKDWSMPSRWKPTRARTFKAYPDTHELSPLGKQPATSEAPPRESQDLLLGEDRAGGTSPPPTNASHPDLGGFSSDDAMEDDYAVDVPSFDIGHQGVARQRTGLPKSDEDPETLGPQDTVQGGPSSVNRGHGSSFAQPEPFASRGTAIAMPDPSTLEQGRDPRDFTGYIQDNRRHFSIRGSTGFSLSRSHSRAPISRDWSTRRKRWVATVACLTTALLGLIIGIYAGEVPAIQYSLADEHHWTILGNVVLFIGLAIPTALFWPLPLLHGRKVYTLSALILLLALHAPMAVIVGTPRSPYAVSYRVGLLISRAFAGLAMGFANINSQAILLDLFGSSLQSLRPHQEVVDENDVRRHGGGVGLWLGIWTWSFIGSLGVGFQIGAGIISTMNVSWGFWVGIVLTTTVLLLNIWAPETRRSPYRRSMAEVKTPTGTSRRIARGEVKMHLYSTGPKNWREEVAAGCTLSFRMLRQRGFAILAFYQAWIYGQVILVIVLLGALMSKYYRFRAQYVGLCVLSISIGAILAVPFQKASVLSRARSHPPRTDSMTFEKRFTRSSHMVRRATFMIVLPFAGLALTLSFGGRHVPFILPVLFAGLVGFLSTLAIAECSGLIMETFDTSDLQPGMTGRPRKEIPGTFKRKQTNYSCYPRVTAAFAITQSMGFLIAGAATAVGGTIERELGVKTAIAVVAGVLLLLTVLLIGALFRFKTVQIVPNGRYGTNVLSGPENEWKPVIIGHPSGTTRRISLLELGGMTRWTEIRRRNRLLDRTE